MFLWDIIKITFDGNKLKNSYKFVPYDYFKDRTQSEEIMVLNNKIGLKNWKDYIINIEISSNFENKYGYTSTKYTKEEVISKIKEINL